MSYTKDEIISFHSVDGGSFTGVFDMSQKVSIFYDDYNSGSIVNLSLSSVKALGSICTVRIKGDLIGTIPTSWNLSGQPITTSTSKLNELTVIYISNIDIRIVNRIVNYIDTIPPSVPEGLASNSILPPSFYLTWNTSTDNVGVTGYNIYKDGTFLKTSDTNTSHITGLSESTTYIFSVSSFDAAGNESAQSIGLPVITSTVTSYDSDYQSALNYATTNGFDLPSNAQKATDNQKIINLKAEGVYSELDILYICNATYIPSSFAKNFYRINFKSPGTLTLTSPSGLEPDFISGSGFYAANYSGKYLKTGYTPSVGAVKLTPTSNSCFFKPFSLPTTFTGATYFLGGREGNDANQILFGISAPNSVRLRLIENMSGQFAIMGADINQHYHILTIDPYCRLYIKGVASSQGANSVGSLPSHEIYILGYNDNGTFKAPSSNAGISYLAFGSNLESKQDVIYSIMNETY